MKRPLRIVVLIETSREWGRQMLLGITKYARLHGLWSFYQPPPFYRLSDKEIIHRPAISDPKPDGVFLGGDIDLTWFLSLGIPSIIVDVRDPVAGDQSIIKDTPWVTGDGEAAGIMAAKYYMNLGLRHFAFCGYREIKWSSVRLDAYGKTLRGFGKSIDVYESPIATTLADWDKEKQALIKWLEALPKPIGLFACNDDCGRSVIDACRDAQIKVPDEIAVLGVDNDIMICELADPPISSVVLNVEKAGYEAAATLDKLMAGDKVKQQKITVTASHIITRYSTEIPAIDDPAVLQALRFIQQNAAQPIQVDDVATAAALSRRSLSDRFRDVLKRSIHDEISRVRVERIAQMLLETDVPVLQIAVDMGFTSPEHVSRFFKKEKGMTPNEFRNRFKKPVMS